MQRCIEDMPQKKTVTKRCCWASIKREKADTDKRRVGYRQAKEAFELVERVRQAREHFGLTQAELASLALRAGAGQGDPQLGRQHAVQHGAPSGPRSNPRSRSREREKGMMLPGN
jgi:hypothetical protein